MASASNSRRSRPSFSNGRVKKIERGTLYLCGIGDKLEVVPANGKKFTYEEQAEAVGGYIEMLVPAVQHTLVYANEEGATPYKDLPLNRHTWEFANKRVYLLNGYGENWRARGNILVVRKVDPAVEPATDGMPKIAEFMGLMKKNGGVR
jgi:hypothetical protein